MCWWDGWFLFLFFAYPVALGLPMPSKEVQYTFWCAKLNFAEIILWPVMTALPGRRQEQAFVYYSLEEVHTTAPQHLAHGKSSHKHPCPVGIARFLFFPPGDTNPASDPDGTPPPGWGTETAEMRVLCLYRRY